MKESDIAYENGRVWVFTDRKSKPPSFDVYVAGITHSVHDSSYALDEDGLSIAKARADYLARRILK